MPEDKQTAELTPEEQYAVRVMRELKTVIHPDIHGGPLLLAGNLPVCTWQTLFSLLGRGIVRHFPTTNRYGLSDLPQVALHPAASEWVRRLQTYQSGEEWAVWADEHHLVQLCRRDEPGVWATPIGHMSEEEMRRRGWIKADGSEGT